MKTVRRMLFSCAALLAAVPAYYAAAFAGAIIGAQSRAAPPEPQPADRRILILSGFLHADLALPADAALLERFSFLSKKGGLPLDNPNLRYLVVGWGARDFYMTAGTYSDIRPMAVLSAIFGDRSVMHVVASGDISSKDTDGVRSLTLQAAQYEALLQHIEAGFARDGQGSPILIPDVSHGYGDVFYEGVGRFNILRPCNAWTGEGLRKAGVRVGVWTPTAQSLGYSLTLAGHD